MAVTSAIRLDIAQMRGSARRRRKERAVKAAFGTAAGVGLVISVAIVLSLIGEAVVFLTKVELGSLWAGVWSPRTNEFDIPTLFMGTLMIAVIATVVAAPLGLGAAMFLSEYAQARTRRLLKPIIETLAGIPSVVLGYFALTVINPGLVQTLFSGAATFNFLAAGIAVGILVLPLVATVAEDAMHAVPEALREAAYGLGARRRTVTSKIVVPAAVSGIAASMILAFSRAVGETMVVAIAAGAAGNAVRTMNPLDPGQTMTGAISSLAIGSDQVRGSSAAFVSLYFVGLLLFAMTFALNMVSERIVRRARRMS